MLKTIIIAGHHYSSPSRGILTKFRRVYQTSAMKSNTIFENLKPSASLIVVAPNSSGTKLKEYDYKVLMLRRSSTISSFMSAHVFPGGNVDAAESLKEWLEPTKSPLCHQCVSNYNPFEDTLLKYKLCAVRETFEETGLLLTKRHDNQSKLIDVEELQGWRNLIYQDAGKFIEVCREQEMYPTVEEFVHFSNWITPISYPKRYDTHFFLTFVDSEGLESTVVADGQESLHAVWYTPGEALEEFNKGRITLFPPQWYTLNELSRSKTISELKQYLNKRGRIVPFIPQFQKADSRAIQNFPALDALKLFSILPGDEAYTLPSMAVSRPGSRHRLWVCKDKDSQRMFDIRLEKNGDIEIEEPKIPILSKI